MFYTNMDYLREVQSIEGPRMDNLPVHVGNIETFDAFKIEQKQKLFDQLPFMESVSDFEYFHVDI